MEPEDTYAVAVLRVLDDQPRTPSRVDVPRAINVGRRRRRVRRLLQGGAAGAMTVLAVASVPLVLSAVPSPDRPVQPIASNSATASPSTRPENVPEPKPPTQCTVRRLPVPGGHPMSLVTGGDPTGRFIVGRAYPEGHQGEYPLIIWDNGKGRTVTMPGADQAFRDITSTGVAVGTSYGDGPKPYVYRNGALGKLGGVTSGSANAINEAGVIVGSREDRDRTVPVRWRYATYAAEDLPLPRKNWSGEAIAVADDGTILGRAGPSRDVEQAYVWLPDGTGRLLPKPPGFSAFRPFDMNAEWVTGVGAGGSGEGGAGSGKGSQSFLYNLRTGRFTPWSAASAIPSAVNAAGWVVGSTDKGSAFMYSSRGMLMLPDFNNHRSPVANLAETISNDGRTIAGQGDDAKGVIQAVVWRCR